jgi:transposase
MTTAVTIYPTLNQITAFNHWQNNIRWTWNECVGKMREQYEKDKTVLRKTDFMKLISTFKQNVEWLKDTPTKILEFTIDKLDREIQYSLDNGYDLPTFNKKKKERGLINIELVDTISINGNMIQIPEFTEIATDPHQIIPAKYKIQLQLQYNNWVMTLT